MVVSKAARKIEWWWLGKGARYFAEKRVDYGRKSKLRAPELFRAVKSGNTAGVTKLIVIGKVDTNVKDVNGWTPLHHACIRGYSGIAQLLLGSGAIIEPLTNDRRSPLELAKIAGHGNVMTVLRKALSMQCLVPPLSVEEKELIFQHHTCQQQQLSTGRDDCLYPGNRGQNKVAGRSDRHNIRRPTPRYVCQCSISALHMVASNHNALRLPSLTVHFLYFTHLAYHNCGNDSTSLLMNPAAVEWRVLLRLVNNCLEGARGRTASCSRPGSHATGDSSQGIIGTTVIPITPTTTQARTHVAIRPSGFCFPLLSTFVESEVSIPLLAKCRLE